MTLKAKGKRQKAKFGAVCADAPRGKRAYELVSGLLALVFTLAIFVTAMAQSDQQGTQNQPQSQPKSTAKEYLGPAADSIRPYKPAGRDPFKKAIKPKEGKKSSLPVVRGFPALDVRRAEFRQKVDLARSRDLTEPDPVSQYLISELDVLGVFRDDQGFGAFLRAQPTGTMFFVRRGSLCYNGAVLRIDSDEGDIGTAKVMFREISYLDINGKQTQQERVVAKLPASQK
jgi:hypothetical protein